MKDIDLEIINASFEQFRNGNYIGYTPISCVGKFYSKDKSISVETEQLRGLSIFRMFENQRAKDFKACYMLYQKRSRKNLTGKYRAVSKEENSKSRYLRLWKGGRVLLSAYFAEFSA